MTLPEYQMLSSTLQISKRCGPQAGFAHTRQKSAAIFTTNRSNSSYAEGRGELRNFTAAARGLKEPVPDRVVSEPSRLRGAVPEDYTVTLLKWALLFFLISVVAGILGFTGISAASADIARILFYIFLVIFLVLLILGLTIFRV